MTKQSKYKIGDEVWVNTLTSPFCSKVYSEPFFTKSPLEILGGKSSFSGEYVIVKDETGKYWNAPVEIVEKIKIKHDL